MRLRQHLGKLNRVQKTFGFKVIASILVAVIAIVAVSGYILIVTGPARQAIEDRYTDFESRYSNAVAQAAEDQQYREGGENRTSEESRINREENATAARAHSAVLESQRIVSNLLRARQSPASVAAGASAMLGIALLVIWLGIGLTYLALAGAVAIIAGPLLMFEGAHSWGLMVVGVCALTGAFAAIVRALESLLAGPRPVLAVARLVLSEAVRMRVSAVFIVLLIFMLAALPGLLDQDEELRYRVQSFLQYATGGTYVLLAVLTVFFSVATVSFEQRDKTIWQTVTKPVAAWQYVLGKWLGVMVLNAALLGVCASGIFMFTEYLRAQPAIGERSAYDSAADDEGLSRDRLLLETRVLTARKTSTPKTAFDFDGEEFEKGFQEYLASVRLSDPNFARSIKAADLARRALFNQAEQRYRSIPPGEFQSFLFTGLDDVIGGGKPLTFRFNIDAGGNRPDETHLITFGFLDTEPMVRECITGFPQALTIGPWAVDRETGTLRVDIANGDSTLGIAGRYVIAFPKDGLEISYSVGGFRANFFRVITILWLKLGFLAMVGVCAGTFLSFPVASLITVGVALAAEGAGFVTESLESYATLDRENNVVYYKVVVNALALAVSWVFRIYADLKPTQKLVDGVLLSWGAVGIAMAVIAAWTLALFGAAVFAFRRRELAIYSGV